MEDKENIAKNPQQKNAETTSNQNLLKKELFRDFCKSMNDEMKFKFWIKTLLSSYQTIPEIIKTIDKIIEIQASTVSFSSDIFNGSKTVEGQVEKVIDMTERKSSLLNIYIMTKELLKNLTSGDYGYIEKKFIYNWSIEEISKYFGISTRTSYRKIDKAIDEIYHVALSKNWSTRFIESQISREQWLKGRFMKIVHDYFKNSNLSNSTKVYDVKSRVDELEKAL